MPQMHHSLAALRISGDDLKPAEITRMLGCEPSFAQTKGEERVGKKTEHVWIASAGMWGLDATDREPGDLDGQIAELVSKLTNDLAVWDSIAEQYHLDLYCGLFMNESYEGLCLGPQSLVALGLRHIELYLNIYDLGSDFVGTQQVSPA